MNARPIILIAAALTAGMLLGIIATLIWNTAAIYAVIDYEVGANDWLGFLGAILGALATIVAALVAYYLANRSTEALKVQELIASRAILAHDLSRLCKYLDQCSSAIHAVLEWHEHGGIPPNIPIPTIPTDILVNLHRLVSLLPTSEATYVAHLLSMLQIQHSRLSDEIESFTHPNAKGRHRVQTPENLEGALTSTIHLYIDTVSLFPYARLKIDTISAPSYNEDTFFNAVLNLELDDISPSSLLEQAKSGITGGST